MSKTSDRKALIAKINTAAAQYKHSLVGKRFLYAFDNRYIEVIFKADNFRHLTGVDTNLSARQFYKLAVQGKLTADQIFFSAQHPYQLCARKVKHIEEIALLTYAESFMLEEISTNTTTYKFGTTDLKFSLCMNRQTDDAGNEVGECYIVQSLRDEDCFSKSRTAYEVTHILCRKNDEKQYNTVLFMDKRYNLFDLPKDVQVNLNPKV